MSRLFTNVFGFRSVAILTVVALTFSFFAPLGIKAQNRQLKQEESKSQEKRIALVIGNSTYEKAKPLPNPANDAADMAQTLKDLNFEVLKGVNQNKRQMETLIREFGAKLATSGGTGLFYYAGHGIQVNGENYLVPIEADIPEEDEVSYSAVPVSLVLTKMMTAKNDLNIVILDACRNNPFARSWRAYRDNSNSDGLAKISPPTGTLVLYATEPGKVASDGAGRNGLFTEALLKQIKKQNVEYDQMVKAVSADVWQKSNKKQLPWKEGNTLQDFYFARSEQKTSVMKNPIPTDKNENKKTLINAAQQHFQKGNEFYISGDKINAIEEYKKAINLEPSRALYQYTLGYAFVGQRKYIEAEIHLSEAVKLEPKNARYRYYYGFCLRLNKKLEESENQLRETVKIEPQNAEYQFELGNLFYARGKLIEAETAYQEAIRLDQQNEFYLSNLNFLRLKIKEKHLPGKNDANNREKNEQQSNANNDLANAEQYLIRGNSHFSKKQFDLAIVEFTKAIELDSENSTAYFNRGVAYRRKNEFDKAIADYTKAIEFNPKNGDAYNNRGSIYTDFKKEYDKAIADFTKAIELNPQDATRYYNRALAYERKGDKAKTKEDRQKAKELEKLQQK